MSNNAVDLKSQNLIELDGKGGIINRASVGVSVDDELRISADERERLVTGEVAEFPKYTTQILNPANQNAQSTRPKVVGQMSEIIDEFHEKHPEGTYEDWVEFYYEEYDGKARIEEATQRLADMVDNMREAMAEIDEEMIRAFIEDLVLYKTYEGFDIQEAILKKIANEYDLEYSRSTPAGESKGVDGYLDDYPVSVKPETYKQEDQLQEDIQAPIIYYEEYSTSKALRINLTELKEALDIDTDSGTSDSTLNDFTDNN